MNNRDTWYTGFEVGDVIVWLPAVCGPTMQDVPASRRQPSEKEEVCVTASISEK